ncbi:MAG: metallophosphoesterase family protein [Bacteroidota bacterium]|nr:metallophosphoesterase family protein [Bacteroidota bacterium]
MKIAVISDIHGNLEALTAALSIVEERGIETTYCLGDIVGYGANPNECIDELRSRNIPSLLGNHDEVVLDRTRLKRFTKYAKIAAEWTESHLTAEHKEYLSRLPLVKTLAECTFVHASPNEPHEWNYVLTQEDARQCFPYFSTEVCCIGHSHVPGIYCEDGSMHVVEKGKRYLINVGSVGQPRDGDWRLSFGVFDFDSWSYEHVRAEYDVETSRQKIIAAGLPHFLAERIRVGI